MLSNMVLFVLFVLVVLAYVVANAIMSVIAIKDDNTISDILSDQDYGFGKVGVSLMYWPTFIVIYIKSLLPIHTKSCFDEDNTSVYKYYSLSDILQLPEKDKVIVTPDNYYKILQYIIVANKNKDVDIDIRTACVNEKYLDSCAFYGVQIGVLNKKTLSNGVEHYLITCYNASRDKIKA